MRKIHFYFLIAFLTIINATNSIAQIDTVPIGDTIRAPKMAKLNAWRNCSSSTAKDKIIVESLLHYEDNYHRLLSTNKATQSKCVFSEFLRIEARRSRHALEKVADHLFEYKTFEVTKVASYTDAYIIIQDPFFGKFLGDVILQRLEYKCDYFNKITEEEKSIAASPFNSIIYKLFNDEKEILEKLLAEPTSDCFDKNAKIILRSLDLIDKLLDKRKD